MALEPFLLHSHHYGVPRQIYSERVITLVEEGGLSVSDVGGQYSVPGSTARACLHKYPTDEKVGRCRGTGLWCVSTSAEGAVFSSRSSKESPLQGSFKAATNFPAQKRIVI
jgi:hypothetical protein